MAEEFEGPNHLASQKSLNTLSKKFNGRTPIRIHFLDNSSKMFLVDDKTTVKELIHQCLQKIGVLLQIDDSTSTVAILPYFSLFECLNGSTIENDAALNLSAVVVEVIRSWGSKNPDAKLLFLIHLYMPCLWGYQYRDVVAFKINKPKTMLTLETYFDEAGEHLLDPTLLHLQFIQAVYQVISGRYPTTADQAIELGAIHFLHKFGEYKPSTHVPGFLGNRIVEFIPIKHLKSSNSAGGRSLEDWERALLEKVLSYATGADEIADDGNPSSVTYFQRNGFAISPQRKYMELVYSMPAYGCSFFRCTGNNSNKLKSMQLLPDVVYIGIHHHGVHIFDKSKKSILWSLHIEEIHRWGFKPKKVFYFEFGAATNSNSPGGSAMDNSSTVMLEFDSQEGNIISDLLTDYAVAFLKEREREDDRLVKMKSGKLDLSSGRKELPSGAFEDGAAEHGSAASFQDPVPPPPSASAAKSAAKMPPPPPDGKAGGQRQSLAEKIMHAKKAAGSSKSAEVASAIKIQALFRGFSLRNEWAREDAAILIQSVYRGYRGRARVSYLIEQLINAGEI